LQEKTVTLDIVKRLSSILSASGVQVVMTRSADMFVPLESRVAKANRSRAQLFVSVHINANRKRALSGFEVYYVSPQVNDYKRAKSAAGEYSLYADDGEALDAPLEIKRILWDMVYCYSRDICREMDNEMKLKILGIKSARFHVLRGANMPAILIEAGFVSNSKEESLLRDPHYRQKIAESIAGGIESYAGEFMASSR
jgi:N-acetylmuramoyl-L-alanine amidase